MESYLRRLGLNSQRKPTRSYLQLSDYDPLRPANGLISISTRCINTIRRLTVAELARNISTRLVCPKQPVDKVASILASNGLESEPQTKMLQ